MFVNETEKKLQIITEACASKKGLDIDVLRVGELTSIADAFVLVSGTSTTQVGAIADEVEEKMSDAQFQALGREGRFGARWIVLDYGDVLVHIFHREEREYYGLERLWSAPSKGETPWN